MKIKESNLNRRKWLMAKANNMMICFLIKKWKKLSFDENQDLKKFIISIHKIFFYFQSKFNHLIELFLSKNVFSRLFFEKLCLSIYILANGFK